MGRNGAAINAGLVMPSSERGKLRVGINLLMKNSQHIDRGCRLPVINHMRTGGTGAEPRPYIVSRRAETGRLKNFLEFLADRIQVL